MFYPVIKDGKRNILVEFEVEQGYTQWLAGAKEKRTSMWSASIREKISVCLGFAKKFALLS